MSERTVKVFKRVLLSVSLLVIAVAAITAGMFWLGYTVSGLTDILDRTVVALENGEAENAAAQYEEFSESYEKDRKHLALFIHDSVMDEIDSLVSEIKMLISDKDTEKAAEKLKNLRNKIGNIWDSVIPTAENIF